jgi:hypothetical protein
MKQQIWKQALFLVQSAAPSRKSLLIASSSSFGHTKGAYRQHRR